MNMTIYDYANNAVEVQLPDKEISIIYVTVLSGDETGTVYFTDDSKQYFDASNDRMFSFYDGSYNVEGADLEKWMAFTPPRNRTASYARMDMFTDEEDDA